PCGKARAAEAGQCLTPVPNGVACRDFPGWFPVTSLCDEGLGRPHGGHAQPDMRVSVRTWSRTARLAAIMAMVAALGTTVTAAPVAKPRNEAQTADVLTPYRDTV